MCSSCFSIFYSPHFIVHPSLLVRVGVEFFMKIIAGEGSKNSASLQNFAPEKDPRFQLLTEIF